MINCVNDLDTWLAKLTQLHLKAIELGLERVGEVAKKLSLIHFSVPVITVGGTNGKGSTVAMLTAIYQTAGYRVAAYTSPHLLHFTERLQINSQVLSETDWCTAFEHIEDARGDISLTYFEFTTLAALWLIRRQDQLDIIILEIGMGGRLDAVNIVESDLAIITTIALDHMDYLGHTREAIGYEKAGIFREKKLAICGDDSPPQSVHDAALRLSTCLFCQGKDFSYAVDQLEWQWWNAHRRLTKLPKPGLPLQNAATVLQAIDLLQTQLPVPVEAITVALREVKLTGRMQQTNSVITTILDVTHNPHAAELLAKNLSTFQPRPTHWHAVVGMLKDKDIHGSLMPLIPLITNWNLASLAGDRGASASELAAILQTLTTASSFIEFDTPTLAYQHALEKAGHNDAIIVFGSFLTVAEILALQP